MDVQKMEKGERINSILNKISKNKNILSAIRVSKTKDKKAIKLDYKEVLKLLSLLETKEGFCKTLDSEFCTRIKGNNVYIAMETNDPSLQILALQKLALEKTEPTFKLNFVAAEFNPWDDTTITKVTFFNTPCWHSTEERSSFYKEFGEVFLIRTHSCYDVVTFSGKLDPYLVVRWFQKVHKDSSNKSKRRNPIFKISDSGISAKICCKSRCHVCGGIHLTQACPDGILPILEKLQLTPQALSPSGIEGNMPSPVVGQSLGESPKKVLEFDPSESEKSPSKSPTSTKLPKKAPKNPKNLPKRQSTRKKKQNTKIFNQNFLPIPDFDEESNHNKIAKKVNHNDEDDDDDDDDDDDEQYENGLSGTDDEDF